MMSPETLRGDKPSWVEKDWNDDGYTIIGYVTNFGVLEIVQETNGIEFACIGLGRNYKNTKMQVKILDNEFQVLKSQSGTKYELCSRNFPYKNEDSHHLDIDDVIKMLKTDDNMSVAASRVKSELVKLITKNMKLNRSQQKYLTEILDSCRKPILSAQTIKRKPIITRTPIK